MTMTVTNPENEESFATVGKMSAGSRCRSVISCGQRRGSSRLFETIGIVIGVSHFLQGMTKNVSGLDGGRTMLPGEVCPAAYIWVVLTLILDSGLVCKLEPEGRRSHEPMRCVSRLLTFDIGRLTKGSQPVIFTITLWDLIIRAEVVGQATVTQSPTLTRTCMARKMDKT